MKKINFDFDWEFFPAKLDFFGWSPAGEPKKVNLPHDFTIETDTTPDCADGAATGYYKGGIGCYKKNFEVPEEWVGKNVVIQIDGSYMNTEISINGNVALLRPSGYSPYYFEIGEYLKFGEVNTVQIITDSSIEKNSRWYSGSGLYRHVDLLVGNRLHIEPWGIFVKTDSIIENDAVLSIETTVKNSNEISKSIKIVVSVFDKENNLVANGQSVGVVKAGKVETFTSRVVIENAKLWDLDSPNLYHVEAEVLEDGFVIDSYKAGFGIRTISVDPVHGFRLNFKPLKIKGGCIHHDNGILGAKAFDDAEYRKMKLHKDNGYNAIRCAHNPPSKGLLEACDRLGLLVMDEAFDMWNMGKNTHDYHLHFNEWWERDLEAMIMRDRNHPSIIMWSTGNEIPERTGISNGAMWSKKLADKVKSLDDTRFVTTGVCGVFPPFEEIEKIFAEKAKLLEEDRDPEVEGAVQDFMDNDYVKENFLSVTKEHCAPLDVVGYNYLEYMYEKTNREYPERVICGTESFPLAYASVWENVLKYPHVIGDFTWTSHDYIGEAGIGKAFYTDKQVKEMRMISHMSDFPWRTANCGDFDLCGFGRPQLEYRKIIWGSGETYIAVRNPENFGKFEELSNWGWPDVSHHWNWKGFEGKNISLDIYSKADEVEIFVNGISKERKQVNKDNGYRTRFTLSYEPGEIKAVSYISGQKKSDDVIKTTGEPVKIKLTSDRDVVTADGQSLVFVKVEYVDSEDIVVPTVCDEITATVTGEGVMEALGSANPKAHENYTSGKFTTFEGKALAVIRSNQNKGEITLSITSEKYGKEKIAIQSV